MGDLEEEGFGLRMLGLEWEEAAGRGFRERQAALRGGVTCLGRVKGKEKVARIASG